MAGVLYLAGITAVAAVVIAAILYVRAMARAARRVGIRWGLVAPDLPVLPPAVERLAHDVQRLRADLAGLDPHTPVARRRGVMAAYDDALADACRAMGLVDVLRDVPEGMERDMARLEVEDQLVVAGLIPARMPGR